jgi:prolyl oligopeptidase
MRIMMSLLLATIVGSCSMSQCFANPAASKPPETAVKEVTDTYHGVKVVDPYRWLEPDKDAKVVAWADAQNAHARSILDNLPHVAEIRKRVTAIMTDESPTYMEVSFRAGKYFAIKNQPPKQQPILVVLDSADDLKSERVVVDPNVIDETGGTTIDWYQVSPDGKLAAVSMSKGGSEAGDLHLFDTSTGKATGEVVPHVNTGTAGGDLAWMPDSKGFYYTRHPWPGEKPVSDLGFYQQVFFHELGTLAEKDRYEIGKDFPRIAEIQLNTDERTGRVLATVQDGDGGEFALFLRGTGGRWQKFYDFKDRVVQAEFGPNDDLFLISLVDAPRGKVEHIKIAELGKAKPKTIVPQTQDTIYTNFMGKSTVVPTATRLYLIYQLGGPSEVRAFTHDGKPAPGPKQQSLSSIFELEPLTGDDLLFGSESYVAPEAFYAFHSADGNTQKTALAKKAPVDLSDAEVSREFATSKDGTKVPVNIIRRKGTPLDGNNPAYATGYGGYGVSIAPAFNPLYRILLDNGIVVAVSNIRGGGEYGKQWHLEGNLTKKQNVFDDFYSVIKHLCDRKYTSRERLGIIGGSNGGLLMGATFTQHPDAMKAVVSFVGIYDSLRSELSPNGEFNITEFGTVKNPAHFKAMYAYSPYEHVKKGTCYPAILMLTGANDPRVEPMQSRKMVARLQAAQSCEAPILLRVNKDTGHGIGTPLTERIAEIVDVYAFLFHELGVDFKAGASATTTAQRSSSIGPF